MSRRFGSEDLVDFLDRLKPRATFRENGQNQEQGQDENQGQGQDGGRGQGQGGRQEVSMQGVHCFVNEAFVYIFL